VGMNRHQAQFGHVILFVLVCDRPVPRGTPGRFRS
jgi:hypothetical protein